MRQHTRPSKEPAEKVVQDIRRATRKHYSAEDKIRIVVEGTVFIKMYRLAALAQDVVLIGYRKGARRHSLRRGSSFI